MAESTTTRTLRESFDEHCTNGKMNSKNLTSWMKDAGVMDKTGPACSNSMDITFSKFKTKGKNDVTFEQFKTIIDKTCDDKSNDKKTKESKEELLDTMCAKMAACSKTKKLATATAAKISKVGGVDRMTDTSKYTGSHKERFDGSGKGKGKGGRDDLVENTGYVGQYKGKDTYDEK